MKKLIKIIIILTFVLCIAIIATVKKSNIKKIKQNSKAIEHNIPYLLDLGSVNCTPCKKMFPILAQIEKEYSNKIYVEFIDINEKREESKKYKIKVIPTQILFDKTGKEVFRHEGFIEKINLVEQFKKVGIK